MRRKDKILAEIANSTNYTYDDLKALCDALGSDIDDFVDMIKVFARKRIDIRPWIKFFNNLESQN